MLIPVPSLLPFPFVVAVLECGHGSVLHFGVDAAEFFLRHVCRRPDGMVGYYEHEELIVGCDFCDTTQRRVTDLVVRKHDSVSPITDHLPERAAR
jgi:hypothetical protein